MEEYKFNIVGCIQQYQDFDGASKWLERAKLELTSEVFVQMVKETHANLMVRQQFSFAEKFHNLNSIPEWLRNLLRQNYDTELIILRKKQVLEKLNEYCFAFNYEAAKSIYQNNQDIVNNNEYANILSLARAEQKRILSGKLTHLLANLEFDEAAQYYEQISNDFSRADYDNIVGIYMKQREEKSLESLVGHLARFDFKTADREYEKVKSWFPVGVYDQTRKFHAQQFEKIQQEEIRQAQLLKSRKALLAEAEGLLKKNDFRKADAIVLGFDQNVVEEYESIKSKYIQNDLRHLEDELGEKHGYFDEEKADALSLTGKNILVEARAGSGKTTVVALRVRQLLLFYGAKPHEILVLAFNRSAADEFRGRINKYCGGQTVATKANTLTLHALASRISNTNKNILQDDKTSDIEADRHGLDKHSQIDFLRECFNSVEERESSVIQQLFYAFLKGASEKMRGAFRSDADYHMYLRNLSLRTIAGERVKSKREKYIADCLFEHTILKDGQEVEYAYEHNVKRLLNTRRPYRPDFSLFKTEDKKEEQPEAIIEYFGFTHANPGYPGYFETHDESESYLADSEWKRELCRNRNVPFVELSADDCHVNNEEDILSEEQERECFEQVLKQRLTSSGFSFAKLTTREVLNKIPGVKRRKEELVDQIAQFINRAQKLSYGPIKIRELAEEVKGALSTRSSSFIKIAIRVFEEYQMRLETQTNPAVTDFDGLFSDAIKRISRERQNCLIKSRDGEEKIGNIKYILIDEYQDFSKLFYEMIAIFREANRSISLFCVGDDWQAINSYAGSDLEYFEKFDTKFAPSRKGELLTNHRSCRKIVKHANLLMRGRGAGAMSARHASDGLVSCVEWFRVELKNDEEHKDNFEQDKKYRSEARELVGSDEAAVKTPLEIARCLKTVEYVVSMAGDKSICLLFRNNKLHGADIKSFAEVVRKWRYPDKREVRKGNDEVEYVNGIAYSTAHSFKGKESEIIIIVDANERKFPLFHPDNELMELFGVTTEKVLDEERRLFYVAITRAKNELYLLHNNIEDESLQSDFIDEIIRNGWVYQ